MVPPAAWSTIGVHEAEALVMSLGHATGARSTRHWSVLCALLCLLGGANGQRLSAPTFNPSGGGHTIGSEIQVGPDEGCGWPGGGRPFNTHPPESRCAKTMLTTVRGPTPRFAVWWWVAFRSEPTTPTPSSAGQSSRCQFARPTSPNASLGIGSGRQEAAFHSTARPCKGSGRLLRAERVGKTRRYKPQNPGSLLSVSTI